MYIELPECAKPFYVPLQTAVYQAGGFPLFHYRADGVTRSALESLPEQLVDFYPEEYMLSRVATIDHRLYVIATADKHELDGIDTKKYMRRIEAGKFYKEALKQKEKAGKLSWTLCMYGTPAMAAEVGCSEEDYRQQIIEACFLDAPDPKQQRRDLFAQLQQASDYLDQLPIQTVHLQGADVDLHISI